MAHIIWLIFSVVFLVLFLFHCHQATKILPKPTNNAQVKAANGLSLGINEFIVDYGKHIDNLNKENKMINIATATSYLIATATAFMSYLQSFNSV